MTIRRQTGYVLRIILTQIDEPTQSQSHLHIEISLDNLEEFRVDMGKGWIYSGFASINENLGDILWFLITKTDFYFQGNDNGKYQRDFIYLIKIKLQQMYERKVKHDLTVLETLNEFNIYGDLTQNVLKTYL